MVAHPGPVPVKISPQPTRCFIRTLLTVSVVRPIASGSGGFDETEVSQLETYEALTIVSASRNLRVASAAWCRTEESDDLPHFVLSYVLTTMFQTRHVR